MHFPRRTFLNSASEKVTVLAMAHSPPFRSSVTPRSLIYIAFAASIICIWTMFAWYQGLYNELTLLREHRDNSVAGKLEEIERLKTERLQEVESLKTQRLEEVNKLKEKHGDELMEAHLQIEELNRTSANAGYIQYPGGQLDGMDDIVVVIKTGATEAFKLMPIQLATTLTHSPNHLLFSDHEQQMGEYTIQDSLDECSEETVQNSPEFQLYRDLKKYLAQGQSAEFVGFQGGWELDKYKNTYMMAKTFRQRPNAKWYLFIDADSFVMMSNLVPYLKNLDHTQKLYLGSVAMIADVNFAHGGTGYVISHGAMKAVLEKEPDLGRNYEKLAQESCCGDYVLAAALKDHGIEVINIHPQFQGDQQYKSPMDSSRYCQPVISFHHMAPIDINTIWEYERAKAEPGKYILFQDVFEEFVYPQLKTELLNWDNMCADQGDEVELPEETKVGDKVLSSFEKCRIACQGNEECVQYRVHGDSCKTSRYVMLGWKVPVTSDDPETWRSGWIMDRVDKMRKESPCKQPAATWPKEEIKKALQG